MQRQRYGRTETRRDMRAGDYEHSLHAKACEGWLKLSKLRRQTLRSRSSSETGGVDRGCFDRDVSGGVSARALEDIADVLRGYPDTASDGVAPGQKIYGAIESWRNHAIAGEHPYLYLDAIML